jgi:ABC-type glycerol-3-phosphate transport system substrate-binding protein
LKSCNEDPKTAEGNPYFKNITDAMAGDVWIPITPVQPKIEAALNQMQEEVLFGRKTPEEGLKSGEAECQKLLDEYWAKKKS